MGSIPYGASGNRDRFTRTPRIKLADLTSQKPALDKFSVYDAKARFSQLVERAQSGRSTVITKRGRVVARIVPAGEREWDRSAVLDELEALRKALKIKRRFRIAEVLAEGRL
jgi:prevent-host-death family protein